MLMMASRAESPINASWTMEGSISEMAARCVVAPSRRPRAAVSPASFSSSMSISGG